MVDIQSASAENRREKKKEKRKKGKKETAAAKYNGLPYWVAIKSTGGQGFAPDAGGGACSALQIP